MHQAQWKIAQQEHHVPCNSLQSHLGRTSWFPCSYRRVTRRPPSHYITTVPLSRGIHSLSPPSFPCPSSSPMSTFTWHTSRWARTQRAKLNQASFMSPILTTNPLSFHSRRYTSADPRWASRLRWILLFHSLWLECEFFANSSHSQFQSAYFQGGNNTYRFPIRSTRSERYIFSTQDDTADVTADDPNDPLGWTTFLFPTKPAFYGECGGWVIFIVNLGSFSAPFPVPCLSPSTSFLIYPASAPPAWYE